MRQWAIQLTGQRGELHESIWEVGLPALSWAVVVLFHPLVIFNLISLFAYGVEIYTSGEKRKAISTRIHLELNRPVSLKTARRRAMLIKCSFSVTRIDY